MALACVATRSFWRSLWRKRVAGQLILPVSGIEPRVPASLHAIALTTRLYSLDMHDARTSRGLE